ncbi:MAG: hypothetical protein FWE69_05195 [Clostridiales bacterium]|nr:hypothetical protein [Clostridiales bacterium]
MKKRKIRRSITVTSIVIITAVILLALPSNKISIKEGETITLYYYHSYHSEAPIEQELTDEEAQTVIGILNRRAIFTDYPSCGFSENVSLRIGRQIFCIAGDSCPIIRYGNTNKYIEISYEERSIIETIFMKYGGRFPCV